METADALEVSREAIWVPGQNRLGFTTLDSSDHVVEYRPTRSLCTSRFLQDAYDLEIRT